MANFQPLEGITFGCDGSIDILLLSASLCSITVFLQELDPHAQLVKYYDWRQQDGSCIPKGVLDFHGLFNLVKTPKDLVHAMPGYPEVYLGFTPIKPIWYLCFYTDWDNLGEQLLGRFEITIHPNLAYLFEKSVSPRLGFFLTRND